MSEFPETIWVNINDSEDGCCPVEDEHFGDGRFYDPDTATEYRRADLPPTLSAAMELPEVKDVLTLLTEARADLETYVNADYPASTCAEYPDIARRHARDMELCRRIDAALAAIKETKA